MGYSVSALRSSLLGSGTCERQGHHDCCDPVSDNRDAEYISLRACTIDSMGLTGTWALQRQNAYSPIGAQ